VGKKKAYFKQYRYPDTKKKGNGPPLTPDCFAKKTSEKAKAKKSKKRKDSLAKVLVRVDIDQQIK